MHGSTVGPLVREKPVLLVADDRRPMRELLVQLLSDTYEVIAASDAQSALELCAERLPCVALVDVVMPRTYGTQIVSLLKKLSPRAKVVLMSGFLLQDEGTSFAAKAGADAFLAKPLSIDRLHSAIREALARVADGEREREREREQIPGLRAA